MKLPVTQHEPVTPNNLKAVQAWMHEPLEKTPFYSMVQLIAEVMDESLKGSQAYCVLGTTQRRDAVTMSITFAGDKRTMYAADVADLATQCEQWL